MTATAAARGFSDLTCSAADLVEVLRDGPHADKAFADDLDRITRAQPPVEPSPWGR